MTKRVTFTEFCSLLYDVQRPKTLRAKLWYLWFVIPFYFRYLDWKSKHESY